MAVKDVYFAYFVAVLIALAAMSYAVRVATRGVARSERVGRIGGTPLVSQGVMDWWYWMIDPIMRGMVALGITANGLTWGALLLGIGAGVANAFGMFGLACLLATMSACGDILDGQVARITNTGSNRGELLDAAIDRYCEFAFLAGLVMYFHDSVPLICLVMAAMLACFMVSYASAKAEAMQVSPPRGLMRRHERTTYLVTGVGFSAMFGDWLHARWDALPWTSFELAALAIVAVIGNFAAIQRLVRTGRALR